MPAMLHPASLDIGPTNMMEMTPAPGVSHLCGMGKGTRGVPHSGSVLGFFVLSETRDSTRVLRGLGVCFSGVLIILTALELTNEN